MKFLYCTLFPPSLKISFDIPFNPNASEMLDRKYHVNVFAIYPYKLTINKNNNCCKTLYRL